MTSAPPPATQDAGELLLPSLALDVDRVGRAERLAPGQTSSRVPTSTRIDGLDSRATSSPSSPTGQGPMITTRSPMETSTCRAAETAFARGISRRVPGSHNPLLLEDELQRPSIKTCETSR